MVLQKSNAPFAFSAVAGLATFSCLGTIYLFRQNQLLKQRNLKLEKYLHRADTSDTQAAGTQTQTEKTKNVEATVIKGRARGKIGIEQKARILQMEEIGTILSPFPQRAGCPRQGTLAPHIRSHLVLHSHIPWDVLDGIQNYSHVWVVFGFHLNARGKAKSSKNGKSTFSGSKVRPPRANGVKVGVLATRSPHRPNAVGLSLAYLEEVGTSTTNNKKQKHLVLRGLDLVDGTPIFDIKPYVPSDRLPTFSPSASTRNHYKEMNVKDRMKMLCVPSWVSAEDDELASVSWTKDALENVHQARRDGALEPLYASKGNALGGDDDSDDVLLAIADIIAQDPRALRDGRGKNMNTAGVTKEGSAPFEFTFGTLRVAFCVNASQIAEVTAVVIDCGDITASVGSYPHNIALRRTAEAAALKADGKKLRWAYPVREGITEGLYDLQNGSTWQPPHQASNIC